MQEIIVKSDLSLAGNGSQEVRKISFEKSSSDGVVHRKKSRLSMISIASNLFQRKSMDLDAEDATRLMREPSSSERESSDSDTTDEGI